jgi:xanthine dehydrogenase large subunit
MSLTRGEPSRAMASAPHRFSGRFDVNGQEQFYLEGQICYIVPKEDDGFHVYSSTQHPTEMQQVVCHALNLNQHQVTVEMRRMGGGFGGKESQSAIFCGIAAVAAQLTGRPIKLRPDRDDDMMITGKRHGFAYDFDVGFDDDGRIVAACIDMIANAGFSADLSGPVATRAVCHFDNAYYLEHVTINAYCARTNTQSNTAFRGFGGPQGALAIELIMEDIARALGKDPLAVRKANLYGKTERNTTPYGQRVKDNLLHELIPQLVDSSDYQTRRQAIA